jgi:hypothetical protein
VNQVCGGIGDPNFSFPSDFAKVSRHHGTSWERSDIDNPWSCTVEETHEFVVALAIDWAMARHGLDKQEPIPLRIVQNYIGHLAMAVDPNAEHCQKSLIEVAKLVARVADINEPAAWYKALCKLLNDSLEE